MKDKIITKSAEMIAEIKQQVTKELHEAYAKELDLRLGQLAKSTPTMDEAGLTLLKNTIVAGIENAITLEEAEIDNTELETIIDETIAEASEAVKLDAIPEELKFVVKEGKVDTELIGTITETMELIKKQEKIKAFAESDLVKGIEGAEITEALFDELTENLSDKVIEGILSNEIKENKIVTTILTPVVEEEVVEEGEEEEEDLTPIQAFVHGKSDEEKVKLESDINEILEDVMASATKDENGAFLLDGKFVEEEVYKEEMTKSVIKKINGED